MSWKYATQQEGQQGAMGSLGHTDTRTIPTPNQTSGVGDILLQGWKELTGEAGQERDFNWSKKLQELQNENEWKMMKWKANYDSTENQLARWMKAGGNPNAFFQQGASAAAAAPQGTASGIGNVGSSVGEMRENLKSFWDIAEKKEDIKTKKINNGTLDEMNRERINEIRANIRAMEGKRVLDTITAKQIETLLPWAEGKMIEEIEEVKKRCDNLIAQTNQAKANAKYLDQHTKTELQNTIREQWANTFRQDFNVDPMAPPITQLIQNLAGGRRSAEKTISTVFELLKGTPQVQAAYGILQTLKDAIGITAAGAKKAWRRYKEAAKADIQEKMKWPK